MAFFRCFDEPMRCFDYVPILDNFTKLVSVKNCFLKMPKYAGLFRKMPVNASGMDFTHKCRHFPNPVIRKKRNYFHEAGKIKILAFIHIKRNNNTT